MRTALSTIAAVMMAAGLAACGEKTDAGGGEAAATVDPAIKATVEMRQKNLKELGAAFKTISDETKAAAPDMAKITAAAETVKLHTAEVGNWFPAGSGPETGLKMEALPTIWEKPAEFQAAFERIKAEGPKLAEAAATGDAAAVAAAFPAVGGACKNCHDQFRKKKE